jgi:hypothetical protein
MPRTRPPRRPYARPRSKSPRDATSWASRAASAPELGDPLWYGRGENGVREHRGELTKVAHSKIDQLLREAKHVIEAKSCEIQTRLLEEALSSDEAKAFLEAMPTPVQLLPAVKVDEIQKLLGPMI